MELFMLLFLIVIAVASTAGFTTDSHDSADWKPSVQGARDVRW